jgi:DNA-binding beta-propeller fold protein YncE
MTVHKTLLLALLLALSSIAWDRGKAQTFAQLPPARFQPEGITVDPANGDVYVADFEFASPRAQPPGHVVVFDREGRLLRDLAVAGSSSALLGLDFHPKTHRLLVIDFGNGTVLDVNPATGASTPFTVIGPPPAHGLNALTFDKAGNVYISDSFQGAIWRTGPQGGAATVWNQDPLLAPNGLPPFGANGMAFNKAETFLFVANTATDNIVRIAKAGDVAGDADLFTASINGADGLVIDEHDNLWVCANQSDEIVVVDPTGKAIAKLGDFDGIKKGEPDGLLFPASLVFSGDSVLITNLALDTRNVGFQAVDSQWAAQVKTFTIARLPKRIPKINGN